MIDTTKTYKTRDGRAVTELTKVAGHIVGNLDGFPTIWGWDGVSRSTPALDLIEVKPLPLRTGDIVDSPHLAGPATIVAIHADEAWVSLPEGGHFTAPLHSLEKVR